MKFPAKMLIVDDEPHVRSLFVKLARLNLGAPVIFEAGDTTSAVATFKREKPDMVLLDINLVGGSGLDVLKQILTFDPKAVVVMLTAVNVRRSVDEALALGASGYILKSTRIDNIILELHEIVRTVFGDESSTPAMP